MLADFYEKNSQDWKQSIVHTLGLNRINKNEGFKSKIAIKAEFLSFGASF